MGNELVVIGIAFLLCGLLARAGAPPPHPETAGGTRAGR